MSGRNGIIAGVLVIVVVALFFLLPVVPYSSSNAAQSLVGAKATAGVSPSYMVFGCGLVYNPSIGSTLGSAVHCVRTHGREPDGRAARDGRNEVRCT